MLPSATAAAPSASLEVRDGSREVASNAEDSRLGTPRTMKHNDLQLTEILKLARSCLKYDRLPGEFSERNFFDKFDAERRSASKGHSDTDGVENSLDTSALGSGTIPLEDSKVGSLEWLSPPLETLGEAPPDALTLKTQAKQIEKAVAEARLLLEEANAEYRQEVLRRSQLEKEQQMAEADFQKAQRELKLAKEMVKRQTGEIQALGDDVRELKKAVAEATMRPFAPAAPPPRAVAPNKPKARPRPGSRPFSQPDPVINNAVAAAATPAPPSTSAASPDGAADASASPPAGLEPAVRESPPIIEPEESARLRAALREMPRGALQRRARDIGLPADALAYESGMLINLIVAAKDWSQSYEEVEFIMARSPRSQSNSRSRSFADSSHSGLHAIINLPKPRAYSSVSEPGKVGPVLKDFYSEGDGRKERKDRWKDYIP